MSQEELVFEVVDTETGETNEVSTDFLDGDASLKFDGIQLSDKGKGFVMGVAATGATFMVSKFAKVAMDWVAKKKEEKKLLKELKETKEVEAELVETEE